MNLADLEAFVAVAEAGSINRAALRLRLTQPAITRRVQNLEAHLGGAPLLDRTTKPLVLTPGGRRALDYCRQVLRSVEELKENTTEEGRAARELRVGTAHSLAEIVLGAPLDELRRRTPGLHIQVTSNWTAKLIEEVSSGELDCAIALTASHHRIPSGLMAKALGTERVVVIAARRTPFDEDGALPLSIRDLADHLWILNPAPCGYRVALQRAFDREKAVARVAAEVLGYDLQLSLIERGLGLGLVPVRCLQGHPRREHFRIVKLADFAADGSITMLRGASPAAWSAAADVLQGAVAASLG
jgi:DNA-binding transcriptional LysR family regulator